MDRSHGVAESGLHTRHRHARNSRQTPTGRWAVGCCALDIAASNLPFLREVTREWGDSIRGAFVAEMVGLVTVL